MDTYRYKIATWILQRPFIDDGFALRIKLAVAEFIGKDQHTV